jgi:hypothetical protein
VKNRSKKLGHKTKVWMVHAGKTEWQLPTQHWMLQCFAPLLCELVLLPHMKNEIFLLVIVACKSRWECSTKPMTGTEE